MRSNVKKKSMNSGESSFSGGLLKSPRTMSGVPSSGEQPMRASISSKKLWRGHNVEFERKSDRDSMEFKSSRIW